MTYIAKAQENVGAEAAGNIAVCVSCGPRKWGVHKLREHINS